MSTINEISKVAFHNIGKESETLVDKVRRHRPTLAKEMESCIYFLLRQYKIEKEREYADRLLEIIKLTIAEYYSTESLRHRLEYWKRKRGE